jgi:hypothetical protein
MCNNYLQTQLIFKPLITQYKKEYRNAPQNFINQSFQPRFPSFDNRTMSNIPQIPPPDFTPHLHSFTKDPTLIRNCLNRFTHMWTGRDIFWFYPIRLKRNAVVGFRWIGITWIEFEIEFDAIQAFHCV